MGRNGKFSHFGASDSADFQSGLHFKKLLNESGSMEIAA
jgi:hypothetical protein